jgi:hypothetical protein
MPGAPAGRFTGGGADGARFRRMNQVYEILFDSRPRLGHAIQALTHLAYPPRQPVCGGTGRSYARRAA